jgi:hypothetical protein
MARRTGGGVGKGLGRRVPIHRLLQDHAFDPEQCQAMVTAFEAVVQELGVKDRGDPLCEEAAKKIIELGQQGVRNPQLLRQFAMADLGRT